MSLVERLRVFGTDLVTLPPTDAEPGVAGLGESGLILSDAFRCTQVAVIVLNETAGAGIYTANVSVPEGWHVYEIAVAFNAAWAAATSATLKIGNAADDDGFFTAVNLKTATGSLSYIGNGAGVGAFAGLPKEYTAAGNVDIFVTQVGAGGGTGYTLVRVLMCRRVVNATKN